MAAAKPECVSLLEDELMKQPLKADVVVLALEETQNNESADAEKSCTGNEQYLQLTINLPANLTELLNSANGKTQTILVADRSGSMSGNPWNQVRQALLDIVGSTIADDQLHVDIVVYNQAAEHVQYTARNYERVLGDMNAGGSTGFNLAFEKVNEVIAARKGACFDKVVVVFLTDGHDTCTGSTLKECRKKWQAHMATLGKEVVVHTVGFSSSHDYNFLQSLSQVGTMEGMFRYCESHDGPTALKAKLEELFDFVSLSSGQSVDLHLTMKGDNKVVGLGVVEQTGTIQGQITHDVTEGETTQSAILKIVAETWIYMTDPNALPEVEVKLVKTLMKDNKKCELIIPITVNTVQREMVSTATGKLEWSMRILSRNTDILTTKFADTIAKNGDLRKLEKRLNHLQQRVSRTPIFGHGVTKDMREMMIENVREIQGKIDVMHGMLARYVRGETQSVSMLARAHDLRYEAKFSKSRRQRLMDKRVSKNMAKVKADQAKLKTLTVSKEEIDNLSQEAVGFFFCTLSQNSIRDILLTTDESENAIGFGLAVKRPEHALDDPTACRIHVISGTLVSRTSILDALEYKISIDGQLSAHGGFSFTNPLGCATVGMGREPINAWLPLYITKSHWERVKVLLKPTLGYFCTLDPLGYDDKQLDVLFMVLGNMIGQLNAESVGEHQLRLLFSLQRLCAATVFDFNLLSPVSELVKNFINGPQGRTKDVIPNLCTLIGYLVAMPTNMIRPLLGYDSHDDKTKLPMKARQFWLALINECLRRASGSLFREASDAKVNGVIDRIVHARGSGLCAARETTLARLAECCSGLATETTENIKLHIDDYNPEEGVTVPTVEMTHSATVDKAMDIWAQAHCGAITNKNRAEQVVHAKKVVCDWLMTGRQEADMETESSEKEGATETHETATEDEQFDLENVDSDMLEIIAKLTERLKRASFPHLSAIPGFLAFVHHWLSCDRKYTRMDQNGGLAPSDWVSGVKQAVMEVDDQMKEFQTQCGTVVRESSEPETTVGVTDPSAGNETGEATSAEEKEDDNNSEDSDVYDYDYDDDDEDSYEQNARRRQQAAEQNVSLPGLLHVIDSDVSHVTYIRAMLCQAVEFNTNSKARAGATDGKLKDLGNTENAAVTLRACHASLDQRSANVLQSMRNRALWQRANYSMLRAETSWAFVGYMMNTYKDRDEGFSDLVKSVTSCENTACIPHLCDKLRIMLTGQYEDCSVLANGNIWLPEKKMSKLFEAAVGTEVWSQIEVDLMSNVQIHVYRESDIPNRHGHCNSNPYIPNILRAKLGMEPLPERSATRRGRNRYK